MEEITKFMLIDNIEYGLVDTIKINNTEYFYLIHAANKKDFIIQKGNQELLVHLDDEKEFNLALTAFMKKHNKPE